MSLQGLGQGLAIHFETLQTGIVVRLMLNPPQT